MLAAKKIRRRGLRPESSAGIAALRLGEMRDGKLMYAGKVGTGWGRAAAADIRRQMDALVRKTSPLDERIRKPDTLWVEPRYEADVAFADMTDEGWSGIPRSTGFRWLPEQRLPSPRDRLAPSLARARAPAVRRFALASSISALDRLVVHHVQEGRRKRRACRPEGCYRSSRGRANYPVRVPTPYKHRTPMRSTSSGPRKMKAYGLFSDWKKDQSLSN